MENQKDGLATAEPLAITPAELRADRVALGLSQKALARFLGVSPNTVARWERGELAIGNPVLLSRALERLQNDRESVRYSPKKAIPRRASLLRLGTSSNNLPVIPSALIGRDGEIAVIRRQILDSRVRLLTLTGPGGCGKTRLLIAAAETFLDDFSDGVFFVDLAPIRDPSRVASAISMALGLRDAGQNPVSASLWRFLRHKQALLVLDNFEQVLDSAPLVGDLLKFCPGLQVLATSREALHLRWERTFSVEPLAMPNLERLPDLASLAQVPAVALFIQRTKRLRPDFALTTANMRAVAEICVTLDGLPLAINLAAARGRLLSPQELLTRLNSRLDFLCEGSRDRNVRHRSLRDTLRWSYELLDPSQQLLFRQLGVFVGDFTTEAACAVINSPNFPCVDTLGTLVDKSLLSVRFVDDQPKFRMLETIRDYALEQLTESNELQATRQRHASYYLAVAEQAARSYFGPGLPASLDLLEQEHDNLREALRWAIDSENAETAVRLVAALGEFWWMRGYIGEGLRWFEEALALQPIVPSLQRAKALNGLAMLSSVRFGLERADELLAESEKLLRMTEETELLARVIYNQGINEAFRGNRARAAVLFEESLAIARERGHRLRAAYALSHLARLARAVGQFEQAAAYTMEGFTIMSELGDPRGTAYALLDLCDEAVRKGDTTSSLERCREALSLFLRIRDIWGTWSSLRILAHIAWLRGEKEWAVRLFGAANALSGTTGATVSPGRASLSEQALSAARASLDQKVFNAAWTKGRTMPPEAALEYAVTTTRALTASDESPEPEAAPRNMAALGRDVGPTKNMGNLGSETEIAFPDELSLREVQVLRLIASGLTSKEIASELSVSVATVQRHIANIYNKANVRSRAEATAYALRHGVITLPVP